MTEEAVREKNDAFFNAIAEVIANAAALLDGVCVIALEQAVVGIDHTLRQPAAVQQSIKGREIGEPLLFKNLLEIELDVCLPANEGAVAE